jgi:hypothetical protein
VTSDSEVPKPITAIIHDLLSIHPFSEAFYAVSPQGLWLHDAAWEAIEHAFLVSQRAVHVKVGQLLEALNALRKEWTERQWERVVLGLVMASRLDLLSDHPALEHAWVRLQAQQVLRRSPPEPRPE